MSPRPSIETSPQWEGPLEEVPDPLAVANRYRFAPTSAYSKLGVEKLRTAARRLRAAAYSCSVAARRLDHRADLLEREEPTS